MKETKIDTGGKELLMLITLSVKLFVFGGLFAWLAGWVMPRNVPLGHYFGALAVLFFVGGVSMLAIHAIGGGEEEDRNPDHGGAPEAKSKATSRI